MIAAAPRHLAECYGGDIEALADVAGDFDAQSPEESTTFLLRQWTPHRRDHRLRTRAGRRRGGAPWHPPRPRGHARRSARGLRALGHRTAPPVLTGDPRRDSSPAPGSVANVLVALGERRFAGGCRAIDKPAAKLPAKACFERGPAITISGRAFLVDAAENFFHGNRQGDRAPSACAWDTPILLSLGTFPWVFGSKLHRAAPRPRLGHGAPVKPRRNRHAPRGEPVATTRQSPAGRRPGRPVLSPLHPHHRARPRPTPDLAQRPAPRPAGPQGPAAAHRPRKPRYGRRQLAARLPLGDGPQLHRAPICRLLRGAPRPRTCRPQVANRAAPSHRPQPQSLPEPPPQTTPWFAASPRPERDPWPCKAPATQMSRRCPAASPRRSPRTTACSQGSTRRSPGASKLSEELATLHQAKAFNITLQMLQKTRATQPAIC